ncbi:hypothetical protein IAT38_002718 [Cryptococcus sp. DSM 104549]
MVIKYVLELLSALVRRLFPAMGDSVAGTPATPTTPRFDLSGDRITRAVRASVETAGDLWRAPRQGGGDSVTRRPVLRLMREAPANGPVSERTPLLSRADIAVVGPRPEAVEPIEDVEPIDETVVPGHQPLATAAPAAQVGDFDATPMEVDAAPTQETTQVTVTAAGSPLHAGASDTTSMVVDAVVTSELTQESAPAAGLAPQAGSTDATPMEVDAVLVVAATPSAATTTQAETSGATITTLTSAPAQVSGEPTAAEADDTEAAISDHDGSDFARALGDARPIDRRPDLTERENRPVVLGPAPPQGPPYFLDPVTRRYPLAAPMTPRRSKKNLKLRISGDDNTVFHYVHERRKGVLIGMSKCPMKTTSDHRLLQPGGKKPYEPSPWERQQRANYLARHAARRAQRVADAEAARVAAASQAALLPPAQPPAEDGPSSDVAGPSRTAEVAPPTLVTATLDSSATDAPAALVPAAITSAPNRMQTATLSMRGRARKPMPVTVPPKPAVVTRRKKEGHEDEEDDGNDPNRKRGKYEPESDDSEYESEDDSHMWEWNTERWGEDIRGGADFARHDKGSDRADDPPQEPSQQPEAGPSKLDKGKGRADPPQEPPQEPEAGPSKRDKGKGKAPPPPEPEEEDEVEEPEHHPIAEARSAPDESLNNILMQTGIERSLETYDPRNDRDNWGHAQNPAAGPSRSTPEFSPWNVTLQMFTTHIPSQPFVEDFSQLFNAGPSKSTREPSSPADFIAQMFAKETSSRPAASGSSSQAPIADLSRSSLADTIAQMYATEVLGQPAAGSSNQPLNTGPSRSTGESWLADTIAKMYASEGPSQPAAASTADETTAELYGSSSGPSTSAPPSSLSPADHIMMLFKAENPPVQEEVQTPELPALRPLCGGRRRRERRGPVEPSLLRHVLSSTQQQQLSDAPLISDDSLSALAQELVPRQDPVLGQDPILWVEPGYEEQTSKDTGKIEKVARRLVPSARRPDGSHLPWFLPHVRHQRYDNTLAYDMEQLKPGVKDAAWLKLRSIHSIHFTPHHCARPYTRDLGNGLSHLDIYTNCMPYFHRITMTREMVTQGYDHEHRDLVGPHSGRPWRELARPKGGYYLPYCGRRLEEIVFEYRPDSAFIYDLVYHLGYHMVKVAPVVVRWTDWIFGPDCLTSLIPVVEAHGRWEKLRIVFEPKGMDMLSRIHAPVVVEKVSLDGNKRTASKPVMPLIHAVVEHFKMRVRFCKKWVGTKREELLNLLPAVEYHMQRAADVHETGNRGYSVVEGRSQRSLLEAAREAEGRRNHEDGRGNDFPLYEHLFQSSKFIELEPEMFRD